MEGIKGSSEYSPYSDEVNLKGIARNIQDLFAS